MNNINHRGEKSEPTFQDYIDVVYEHRLLVIFIFIITVLSTLYFSLRSPKLYESEVVFRLALKRAKPTIFAEFTPTSYYYIDLIESEIEVVRSKTIAQKVIQKLGLNFLTMPVNYSYFDSISVDSSAGGDRYQIMMNNDGFQLQDKHGNILYTGNYDRLTKIPGIGSFILKKPGPRNSPEVINFSIEDLNTATDRLRKSVKIMQIKKTDLVSLKAQSRDPRQAAAIANEMANAYIDYSLHSLREEARSSKLFIEEQIKIFGSELAMAEERLKNYKEQSRIFLLDESAKEMIDALARFDATKAQTQVEIEEVKSRLDNLEKELQGDERVFGLYKNIASFPTISNSPLVISLKEKLKNLELQKQKATDKLEITHLEEEIKQVNNQIQSVVNQIVRVGPPGSDPIFQSIISKVIESESQLLALQSRLEALNQVINEFNIKLSRLPRAEVELAQLSRQKKANEEIYNMLLSKLEEAKISEAREIGEAKIIDPANPPKYPVSPKKKQNLILGAILGLVLGISAAFILEYLDTSIRDPREIESLTGVPVLASIPIIQIKGAKSYDETARIEARFITHLNPRSSVAEAYRILRTNIAFTAVKDTVKSIVVSSAIPQEGKSTVIGNLAITFAQMGNRSIIVDTDLRKPVFNKIFKDQKIKGLSDILIGRERLKDVIIKTSIENLDLLTSGPIPPNPTELLG
ncbi:MAG: polysaccharide biosynthesis tyrosine autokinase, partial [candidate division WOR-3 bacterium]